MNKKLFSDFQAISARQWKQKIQADLKGVNYDTLIFHSNERIDVKPFYHQDNFTESYAPKSPETWNIYERIFVEDEQKALEKIKFVLQKGTENLWLKISSETIKVEDILGELNLKTTPIFIEFDFFSEKTIKGLNTFLKNKTHRISLGTDIIGNLAKTGNWYENLEKDHEKLKNIFTETDLPCAISVNVDTYQNAGSTCTQQLAYAMSHVNEYLNFIAENFAEKGKQFKPVFKISIGSNYFFEIAKLKALRTLYAAIAQEYGFLEDIKILAFPTKRNKTLYDYNVNLLRTTTECMSAVLGGANGICNTPYDEIYHHENDFGNRIARNQLLILKEESYFDKVANPSDGSYYIESLTQQLAENALNIFKEIEKSGGFLAQLKVGKIQQKIKESAQKEQQQFDSGELTLVGTNNYQNEDDRMKDELERDPFLQKNPRKTLIAPILSRRLAEKNEQDRLKKE